jgi:RNA polymerase sigma-70 factor (ECF subfamily)
MPAEQVSAADRPEVRIDLTLLSRVVDGDRAAFTELFDRYGPMVLGFLTRMLRHRPDAEEVLQETFLQVWEQAGRYRSERSTPKAWIFLLARSRALDRIRSRDARARRDAAAEDSLPLSSGADMRGAVESKLLVADALQALSPEQRRCVELSFYQGLSLSQIASRLEVPLGTVKSRFLLGMRKLRERLVHEGQA